MGSFAAAYPLLVNKGGRQGLSRSYACCFAEFLKHSCLDHLGLLDPPTSVGLRYGTLQISERGFSRPLKSYESVQKYLYMAAREPKRICLDGLELTACTEIH